MLVSDQNTEVQAIRSLVAAGVSAKEIHELVTTFAVETRGGDVVVEELPVYDELPEGMIDVPSAARKYRRSTSTLRNWALAGRLRVVGRRRASAPGGGYLVFEEADVEEIDRQTPRRRR